MKEFDENTLKENNGDGSGSVYIAYKGKVYDLTGSKLWKNGKHMNRHRAGADMTADIQAAPHDSDVLQRFPQVGMLKSQKQEKEIPEFLSSLLRKIPMLRRHPHPMTIHFPIVFMFATFLFNAVFLITGNKSFEVTAFHCLGAGILFTPVAIITGFYTWWLNYQSKITKPVFIKQVCSFLLFADEIAVFILRLKDPEIFYTLNGMSMLYSILVFLLVILATVIGWYGAHLTFPVEKE